MAGKLRIALLAGVILFLFLATLNLHHHFRVNPLLPPPLLLLQPDPIYSIREHQDPIAPRHVTSITDPISSTSILLPDWEVLSVSLSPLSREINYTCRFPNGLLSPATPAGTTALRCSLPAKLRRRSPFPQPEIVPASAEAQPEGNETIPPELLRWDWLVYDSLTTEDGVILFVKGLNRRQGSYRAPEEFRCMFGDSNAVKTAVLSSAQEVFRCKLPQANAVNTSVNSRVKVSLEVSGQNVVLPSVAYYTPSRRIHRSPTKSLLCACTMVYNTAKLLREWVIYHSAIGVEKFILYDNNSDDDLHVIIEELVQQGYDVSTLLWIWPKTQEAGFSHSAMYAKDVCTWMMYTDIDEFVYSPSWINSSNASTKMLKSILPQSQTKLIGQTLINCFEFGPSGQKSHPNLGVMQGYNCRRRMENRHKSIVLLDAIDESLLNVIHHFKLKEGYKSRRLGKDEAVVNHYKYQAWPEFRNKFRRRVSAYVVDWTKAVNPASKDRAPGLGYTAVEPKGWTEKFCEIRDNRLKDLTQKWFMDESSGGYKMAWQRDARIIV